ncbi:primosomal protein N' [candidate division WOR-3 bacterium 4484_100]|uniref:Replication restart protein PriA n=1 Tax=candidate division WOR-3 bacterium 4484_100 TaxID=1936077 RepID=A0A1V4QI30_UNCW3|nr:MAG: primosomal protein N' [candidate division WOR-3 bacterium 4484_100]
MKVDIAIPRTKFDFLTYKTDEKLRVGDLVLVPLRKKLKYGIVLKINSQRDVPGIRPIKALVKKNFIPLNLLKLYLWISNYYLSPLGDVLKLALPSKILKKYETKEKVSAPPTIAKAPRPTYYQQNAIQRIVEALSFNKFKIFLLFGITGSGKTEVYLRCTEEVLKSGGRVLVLVPEISMTPLLYDRFYERFGAEVATIHSNLRPTQRRKLWYEIRDGKYTIVIGPRSTIFIPIPDLKIIFVDEEHDHSYKEHSRNPRYNARDLAIMRGKFEDLIVVLGSATPQIESYYNAGIGKYQLLTLKQRIDARPLPSIKIIDLKNKSKKFISPELESEIQTTLKKGEQIILFLNRRGFAPSLLCPTCGYVVKCPYCQIPLVYHRQEKNESAKLSCHLCGYKSPVLSICPKCGKKTLLYRGAGTQRIEDMLKKLLVQMEFRPERMESMILRLDRDSVRKPGQAESLLRLFERKEARVLLGTQLVTKGFDFPDVTLVGIVNADIILNLPDFRSGERTFQLLTQVAGRSGRGRKPGQVIIQTFHPEQYTILFSQLQDYPKFYAREMKLRRQLNFPPFSKLIILRFRGKDEHLLWKEADRLFNILHRIKGLKLLGPNRSYYYKIRKDYRVFILLKLKKNFSLRKLNFLKFYQTKGYSLEIDVDPLEVF